MNRVRTTIVTESELQRALDCGELIRALPTDRRAAVAACPGTSRRCCAGTIPTGAPRAGRVPRRRGRQRAARAHRLVGRDRSGAPRGGDWRRAFPDRPDDRVGEPVRRPPVDAASSPTRVEHLLLDNEVPGPHVPRPRDRRRTSLPRRSEAPRSAAPGAQPRRRDHHRRLRRVGGRRRRRPDDAAGRDARAVRVAAGLPRRRGEARPSVRPAARRRDRRRSSPPPTRSDLRVVALAVEDDADGQRALRRRLRSRAGVLLPPARTTRVRGRSARVRDRTSRAAEVGSLAAWPIRPGSPSSRCRTCRRCTRPRCA